MNNTSPTNHALHMENLLKQAEETRKPFPARRLDHLRKQAKDLIKQLRHGERAAVQRFSASHPNFPKNTVGLADAQSVIAREQGFSSWPKMKSSLVQPLLSDEVERVRRKLQSDGKEQFLPMITEESLRHAIIKGIQSYEALTVDPSKDFNLELHQAGWEHWQNVYRPLLLGIVEKGIWPDNALLDIGYEQTDEHGVTYEGLGASLEIRVPGAKYPGFSLAILDLWYRRF
jgi:hypothetical protein